MGGLGLDLSLGARGRRGAAVSVPTAIVLSSDEVEKTAAIGTVVGTLITVGGVAPYTYSELTDAGGLFAIDGDEVKVAADLSEVESQAYEVRVTDANGATHDETFTITAVVSEDNDSGIGEDDGTIVDDGGFEKIIVEDTSSGLKITGKNGGLAKLIFDIGSLVAGQTATVRYTADWSQMSRQGRAAFVGFGFKTAENYHFTGLRGDGSDPAVMHDWRVSGTDFGNRTTGTHVDGGASDHGTKDGPNWLQLEASEDGSTYTLRNSADGDTWNDVFTEIAPSPIADVLSATTFGIAVYLPSNDKGVFAITVTQWGVIIPTEATLSSMRKSVVISIPQDETVLASIRKSVVIKETA